MALSWLNWLIQIATTVGIGIIGYFIRDNSSKTQKMIDQANNKIDQTDGKLEKLEQKFNDFKSDLPKEFVMKDDFIRAMTNVDKKLDKIYDIIVEKKGGSE